MSKRNTLQYRICKACKKSFAIGRYVSVWSNYCLNCEVEGWFDEMNKLGCRTVRKDKLGELPLVVPKRLEDCTKVIVDGTTYRDVTELLFENTKHKKVYSDQEEYKRIMRYRKRKRIEEDYEKEIDKQVIDGLEKGLTQKQIMNKIGISRHYMDKSLERLNIKNRRRNISDEEKAEIFKRAKKGQKYAEIAKSIGRSETAVYRITRKYREEGLI